MDCFERLKKRSESRPASFASSVQIRELCSGFPCTGGKSISSGRMRFQGIVRQQIMEKTNQILQVTVYTQVTSNTVDKLKIHFPRLLLLFQSFWT
jgi:hypothetical protein